MSDSQGVPFGDQPNEETPQAAPETPSAPNTIEIEGKEYSTDDLTELVHRGRDLKADYTRKTQALAEERRSAEEQLARAQQLEEEYNQRLAELEAQAANQSSSYSELDETLPGFKSYREQTDAKLDSILKALNEDRESRSKERQIEERAEAIEADVSQYLDKPYVRADEMVTYMVENNLGPGQANIAYQVLYGPKIAAALAEREAASRLRTPSPMGAGPTSVSPGITVPTEMPGAGELPDNAGWNEFSRAAQEAYNRENPGSA